MRGGRPVRSGKKASAADGAAFDFFPGPGEKKLDVREEARRAARTATGWSARRGPSTARGGPRGTPRRPTCDRSGPPTGPRATGGEGTGTCEATRRTSERESARTPGAGVDAESRTRAMRRTRAIERRISRRPSRVHELHIGPRAARDPHTLPRWTSVRLRLCERSEYPPRPLITRPRGRARA